MTTDGRCNHRAPHKRRLGAPLLCSAAFLFAASLATPVCADSEAWGAAAAQPTVAEPQHQEIVVTAPAPLFRDVRPERNLDEQGVASYGVSTVDEIVEELQSELNDDEEPVFVVNGERIYDLDDIGAYPAEVIKQLQVLPRGSGARVGGSASQRVFNITLHQRMRSATVTAAARYATEGDWHSLRGETILTRVAGKTRGNIAFRVRGEDSLLESDRGIIQPVAQVPYATGANVIAYPDLSGEIDPLLSNAAGEAVTVAPFPTTPSPTLADFAAVANKVSTDDFGRFRTLRPASRNFDLNGTYTTPLARWLTSTTTLRIAQSSSRSLIGARFGLFVLDPSNAASPFSVPVAIAVAGSEPLRSRYDRDSVDGSITLTARIGGSWRGVFNGKHSESTEQTRSQNSDSFTAVALDDSVDPFAGSVGDLIEISSDRAQSRYRTSAVQLTLSGSPIQLPAGDVNSTVEARLGWQGIQSESSFANQDRSFHRSEQAVRGQVEVPLASRRNGFLPALGELSANVDFSASHFSDAGSARDSLWSLTWEPVETLHLRGSMETAKAPPSIEILGAPTIVTPSVRMFDPLTGDTVEVTYISGGNPTLAPQSTDTRRLSAILRLVPSLGLQLSGEYSDTRSRNFVSGLPAASEGVVLAFPDRFVRDTNGTLIRVDVRPVNFANHREQRLRWGLSLNASLSRHSAAGFSPLAGGDDEEEQAAAAAAAAVRNPPTRLQLTINDTIVLKDEILIRSGLAPVDLLNGGAIGIAGGRIRHQLDATAALASGGTGVRLGMTWAGASRLRARIDDVDEQLRFSPLLTFNLRAFADARRLFPTYGWARGARVSLILTNFTDLRQSVRDSSGNTPLQYQPGYRDPLGRTVELEFRKVF